MPIIDLLEKLATHARFDLKLEDLLSNQPNEIREIFLKNNSDSLKSLFPHAEISADRTTIFQL